MSAATARQSAAPVTSLLAALEPPGLAEARPGPGERPTMEHARRALRAVWKYPDFRAPQARALPHILEGRDTLAVFPTGGGKSLLFQVPALLREGVTLVVSPLISLMQDQIDQLTQRGVAAAFLNSTLTPSQMEERMRLMERGELRLVYVAPERFDSPEFLARIRNVPVSLLAVDEAHCVSEWGQDFRPAYRRLGAQRQLFPDTPVLAVTATATPRVRRDIVDFLQMQEPAVLVEPFDRPNLVWRVEEAWEDEAKYALLTRSLRGLKGSAVVYANSQKGVKAIADELVRRGFGAEHYHGGLADKKRAEVQEGFMQGAFPIVVATNAFGMGVDKADVRKVVHFELPSTMESYYQEGGRAGRDGETAECLLLYSPMDRRIPEFLIEQMYPPKALVEHVYAKILEAADPDGVLQCSTTDLARMLGLRRPGPVYSALRILADAEPEVLHYVTAQRRTLHVTLKANPDQVKQVLGGAGREDDLLTLRALWQSMGGATLYQGSALRHRKLSALPGGEEQVLESLERMKADGLVSWHLEDLGTRLVGDFVPTEELPIDWDALERRRELEMAKLDAVEAYATHEGCRRRALLAYFHDDLNGRCSGCDHCTPQAAAA